MADPITMALGGLGANLIGGITGAIAASPDRQAAQQAMQNAIQQIQAVGAPPDLAQQIIVQQFKQAGIYTPEVESALQQGPSQVANVQANQQDRNAQVSALNQLAQRGVTGLSPQDQAALNQIRSQAQTDAQAKTAQILQSQQARGEGGSGAALAAELQAGQSGANMQSQAGLQQAGIASQNALAALQAQGQLGGQLQASDTNLALTRAQAQDQLNRFNIQNQQAVQNANVQAQNQGQLYNLGNAQQISNANVSAANAEQQREVAAQQQMYQDALQQAGLQSQAASNYANFANNQGNATAQQFSNIGQGIGTGLTGLANFTATQNQQAQQNAQQQQLINAITAQNGGGNNSLSSQIGSIAPLQQPGFSAYGSNSNGGW